VKCSTTPTLTLKPVGVPTGDNKRPSIASRKRQRTVLRQHIAGRSCSMFASLYLRSELALQEICDSFADDLPYRSLFPAATQNTTMAERPSTTQDYYSSASAPNLRSNMNQPAMEMMDRPRSSDGDANVKVVVRVRKFIKRGMHKSTAICLRFSC
jgi:hypothetical protein